MGCVLVKAEEIIPEIQDADQAQNIFFKLFSDNLPEGVTAYHVAVAIGIGLVGVYYLFKNTRNVRTCRELCQLTMSEADLKCKLESKRDFVRFYKSSAVYIWPGQTFREPLSLKCGIQSDGGALSEEELSKIINHFLEEIKVYLPEVAKNMNFIERMIPYITTTPGISYTTGFGPMVCMRDPYFVILVTDVCVRVLNIAFQFDGDTKVGSVKILSPNLLTNPLECSNVSLCKTFPELKTSLEVIQNDIQYYQEVLKTNKWEEFIEKKL